MSVYVSHFIKTDLWEVQKLAIDINLNLVTEHVTMYSGKFNWRRACCSEHEINYATSVNQCPWLLKVCQNGTNELSRPICSITRYSLELQVIFKISISCRTLRMFHVHNSNKCSRVFGNLLTLRINIIYCCAPIFVVILQEWTVGIWSKTWPWPKNEIASW